MDDFKCIVDGYQEQMNLNCDFPAVLSKIAYFTNVHGDYISLMKIHLSQNSHSKFSLSCERLIRGKPNPSYL